MMGPRTTLSLFRRFSLQRRVPVTPSFLRRSSLRLGAQASWTLPTITNEPSSSFEPDSKERILLRDAVEYHKQSAPEIPIIIDGKPVLSGDIAVQSSPCDHQHTVCTYHQATPEIMQRAIESCLAARESWANLPYVHRLSIFLKAAHLISTTYRYEMLAAMMVGQGKSVRQAEIDGVCELADFMRFNAKFAHEIYSEQPTQHDRGVWNRTIVRPLEGFVLAIAPFNFTAILGNLAIAPAMMGNVVILKPPYQNIRAGALVMRILHEAGLPPGVINLVPCEPAVAETATHHPALAGIHFTGSTKVFQRLSSIVGEGIGSGRYKTFPRIVGETGGKNFHWVHPSALESDDDIATVATQTIRGAFEYQGQKCSATSRLYVPKSRWRGVENLKENMCERTRVLITTPGCIGDTSEIETFMGGVIDRPAFNRITAAIEKAKADPAVKLLVGGGYDDRVGWFIEPTIFMTKDPTHWLFEEELFGPVLCVNVYDDKRRAWSLEDHEAFLKNTVATAKYGLTGAIFAKDRKVIHMATHALCDSVGNLYINDKSTGAVVAQQAFGGARLSGTNDKSGSKLNLYRWVSMQSIKENFEWPVVDYCYPHMETDLYL